VQQHEFNVALGGSVAGLPFAARPPARSDAAGVL